ncbi:PAS domain S-box protein [Desulfobacter sp.]
MASSSFIGLVNNAALLLALGLIYDLLDFRHHGENSISQQLVSGLILGAIGVAIMLNPWDFGHGVVFDTRSILLCISGFFFGFIPLSLVIIVTATFRLIIGGTGAWIGLAVIISSGGIGLAWQYFLRNKARHPKTSELYLLGIVVHVVMLVWMLFLPWETAKNVLATITIPVMLIYPIGTAALGKLLVSREKRRESENRLQKSEEKFRCLFQYHIAAQLILDPDTGQIVDANKAAENFYGWSVAELQCKCVPDINTLPPEQIALKMNKAKSLKRCHFEFKHRLADGSIRDVEVYSSSIEIEGRQLLHSIIHDISDRQKAEESLREREHFLQTIIKTTVDGFWVLDVKGLITEVNTAYCSMSGYSREELIGKSIGELDTKETEEETAARIERIISKGSEIFETRHSRKDQSIYPIEVSATYLDVDGGKFVCFGRDITERKQAEEALRASEARFRNMVEDAPDPIFIQTQMRFAYLNQKALNLFGAKDAQELIGTPVMERFHPDYHDSVKQRIKGLNEHCKPAELMEQKYLRMDGSTVLVEVTAQPIMYGNNDGALVFVRDITERKNLEAQLMQAQKMESVGRLAGGVAHDYNNMLSIILGYTDFAFEKIDTNHPLFSDLEEIHTAAERSVDITRQLLAFSRKQTIEPTLLDLNESVEGMLKMLRRLIGEDIDIAWHPGEHLWPVFMDPSQLNQIIVNLCVNARDAIKNVGKITIETNTKSFDDEYCAEHVGFRPGDYIMVAVSDDGCGMDIDLQSHIFEPFFTTKEMGKGTGLGLATVYGIVKQNNGFINVYSELGQGTTFRIYIPRPEALLKKLEKKKPTRPYAGGDETILMVEDDQAILKMTKMMLERFGYSVLSASKPEEAIEIANKYSGQIHLFITDVVMPEMNGRDLSKNILSIYPNLKTLFMSGYTANVIAHHGVLDEGVNFIQKPFSREQISVKVRESLDGD